MQTLETCLAKKESVLNDKAVKKYIKVKGDSSRFKHNIITWEAAAGQVNTSTEAKSQQVKDW